MSGWTMTRTRFCNRAPGVIAACTMTLALGSCASEQPRRPTYSVSGSPSSTTSTNGTAVPKTVPENLQYQLMSYADGFSTQIGDVLERFQMESTESELRLWAIRTRLSTLLTASTIASGPNAPAALLDMVVFVTLRRMVTQENWVPELLGERGESLVDAYEIQEREVWALASQLLSPEQQEELMSMIVQWRQENPDQRFVAHVRFSDFEGYQLRRERARRSSTIFQLLALDPLASADPIARELRSIRYLSERLFYFSKRAPTIFSLLAEQVLADAAYSPDGQRILEALEVLTDTAASIATTADSIPALLQSERVILLDEFSERVEKERTATVLQLSGEVDQLRERLTSDLDDLMTKQRKGLLESIAGEEERVQRTLADLRNTLSDAKAVAESITTTTNTMTTLVDRFKTDEPTPPPPPDAEPDRPVADIRAAAESLERSVDLVSRLILRLDDPANQSGAAAAIQSIREAADAASSEVSAKLLRTGLLLIGAAAIVMLGVPLLRQWISIKLFRPAGSRTI